ncbi:hypothetical protein [Streptomyces sp. 3N207]|uniref:hypothetical protein n=1 Tax=Streptomyces sp. 3N207 TaxID=3457417 RepID=UPI003FD0340C
MLSDDAAWHDLYGQAAAEFGDLVSEVRTAVDYGLADPEDSAEVACAATETTEAVVTALSHEWALYTPQEAATVASALFLQLQHSADALAALRRAVGHIAERGETELLDSAGPGQPANLADALQQLHRASNDLHRLVSRHASTTVRALAAAKSCAPIPRNAHETIVAVARLLEDQHDDQVQLNERHGPGEDDPAADDVFGCSCDITVTSKGETFSFHRGDCAWSLLRDADGRPQADGSILYSNWSSTSTSLITAHPQQLTQEIIALVTSTD